MSIRRITTAALAAALLVPATSMAGQYPPPSNPGGPDSAPKDGRTLKVCKKGKRCFKTIQKAVNAARAGDTVKVANGRYREGVKVSGRKKAFLKLVGNPRNPKRVVIDNKGLRGAAAQNSVFVNGANNVTVNGFTARNYKGNGFFVVNVTGYKLTNLRAEGPTGVYGIYAFNSKGGQMTNSDAFYHKDAGFYVGQTPPQTRPRRTIVRNVRSWGNALGWSGTNMRYVTITDSEFFNNAVGLVPNALDSERFPPAEENVISDNDIFWNNFNYHRGAPFKPKKFGVGFDFPPGMGILLFGSRTAKVDGNRIFGNYLLGVGLANQFQLEDRSAADPVGNQITNNDMGLGGNDLNGRDLAYDGSGRLNCFSGNILRSPTVPADGGTFAPCPGPDPNTPDNSVLVEAGNWITDETHEQYWIRNPHAQHEGYNPLEHWTPAFEPGGDL